MVLGSYARLLLIVLSLSAFGPASAFDFEGHNRSGEPLRSLRVEKLALSFRDDFRSLDISDKVGSGARWFAHTPWFGDFGDATFVGAGPGGPFSTGPRGLRITASRGPNGRWRSGLISSRDHDGFGGSGFAQQFGYFEISAKLPKGDGVWPAFWLIGVDKRVSSSEIDVFEFYGRFPEYYHVVTHLFHGGKDKSDNITLRVPKELLVENFNTYGVLIESDVTTFYLNRKPVAAVKTPPEYHQPFYVLANLALGGGWPISGLKGDQVMEIEYIQVFKLKE